MGITRRADYAVRLMYELAQLPAELSLSMRDLCEAAEVPSSFGAPLIQFLAEAELVRVSGHRDHLLALAVPASEITMAHIVKVSDPDFALAPCTLNPGGCSREPRCGVHRLWERLDGMIWHELEAITLEEVVTGKQTVGTARLAGGALASGLIGTA